MSADHRLGLLALNRFGLGGRADGDLAAASGDPRGFLLAELRAPGIAVLGGPDLPTSPAALVGYFADQEAKRMARAQDDLLKGPSPAPPMSAFAAADTPVMTRSMATGTDAKPAPPPPTPEAAIFRAEALARLGRAASARAGLVERLVAFWSNHFCVSVAKGGFIRVVAGAFEREAIRPHVLGRFSDMLLAAERHPAMIFFLDNQQSAGPASVAGMRRGRGLNENLGREILELHTLGVAGGYTQADVTSLAKIISGWSFVGREGRGGAPGASMFVADFHEPGPQTLLGQVYAQDGRAQGEAALQDLARHPATARHIATKLAQHFVADDPPPALVARLADTFVRTDGDLLAVATKLVDAPEAWATGIPKLRDPWQFIVATIRLTGRTPTDPGPSLGALALLGQPLWAPPGPNGFSDNSSAWTTPEGMKTRLDIADRIAARIPDGPNPVDLYDALAGSAASRETRQALAQAASRRQGLALLLMSPEMQRR